MLKGFHLKSKHFIKNNEKNEKTAEFNKENSCLREMSFRVTKGNSFFNTKHCWVFITALESNVLKSLCRPCMSLRSQQQSAKWFRMLRKNNLKNLLLRTKTQLWEYFFPGFSFYEFFITWTCSQMWSHLTLLLLQFRLHWATSTVEKSAASNGVDLQWWFLEGHLDEISWVKIDFAGIKQSNGIESL